MSEASSSSSARSNEPPRNFDARIVAWNEVNAAADCLAEAFADDDVAMYFVNTKDTERWSKERKWDLHVQLMRCIVSAHYLKGLALTIGPDHDAVALWMPPGKNMDDWLTMLLSGMTFLNFKLPKENRCRFDKEFLPLLHRTKQEVLGSHDANSWYLVYIGTKPKARGKGYARKLIEYVTKQVRDLKREADDQGRLCYLESSNDINPVIYSKMGFEMVKKIELTRGPAPVEMDIMVRNPIQRNASHQTLASGQHDHALKGAQKQQLTPNS
ncbi:MAG: hypothetical protein Q9201_004854 [Fulgogasparrea decipioides]